MTDRSSPPTASPHPPRPETDPVTLQARIAALERVLRAHKQALRRMGDNLNAAWRLNERLGETLRRMATRHEECATCKRMILDMPLERMVAELVQLKPVPGPPPETTEGTAGDGAQMDVGRDQADG